LLLFAFYLLLSAYPYVIELFYYQQRQKEHLATKIMRREEAQNLISSSDRTVYEKMLEDRQILVPESEEFGILIPKTRANAKIIPEVDFLNRSGSLALLQDGVAHAQWSGYPDKKNTITLFSHNGDSFFHSTRYNIGFLLLDKLSEGDDIKLYSNGIEYNYRVSGWQIIKPSEVNYIDSQQDKELLKVYSQWPLGTNWRRIVLTAERTD